MILLFGNFGPAYAGLLDVLWGGELDDSKFLLVETGGTASVSDMNHWGDTDWQGAAKSVAFHGGLPVRLSNGIPEAGYGNARRLDTVLKRAMDVVVSICAVAALMPLFLIVAVAIKMTSAGPVLFRQYREGLHGTPFLIYKFRSLAVEVEDRTGVAQTRIGDPRVTGIGRFIRRTSIDELPQLLNVLLGHMSLVGPRPHVANMLAGGMKYVQLVPYYDLRLQMRPGLTGWAQANGLRGSTEDAAMARARVDYDIAYIQNFNILLDLRILLKTIAREFLSGSGE